MVTLSSILLSIPLLCSCLPSPAQGAKPPAAVPGNLGVLRTLKVGGEGAWDYLTLDAKSGRIFLPRSNRVMVLGLEGKSKGEIPNSLGVHGVALATELDRGFTSNGRSNTMTVFKLSTLEVIKEVKTTGENPDSILYDTSTRQVFTFNGRGQNATVLNAETLEVAGTIPIGGKPEYSVCDGRGRVFVNVENSSELLAIDVSRQRLYVVGRNKLMAIVDATNGKLLKTLPIGDGCDGVVFDSGTGCAYAANGEGTLTVVRGEGKDTFIVAAIIPTKPRARTLAVDEARHLLYLPTAEFAPEPKASSGQHSRPSMLPDSFQLLVVGEAR